MALQPTSNPVGAPSVAEISTDFPLSESSPLQSSAIETHRFVVTVETGSNKWDGTDGDVHIRLFGDRHVSDDILLRDDGDMVISTLKYMVPTCVSDAEKEKNMAFQPGSVREFSFKAPFVGNLVKIIVQHDAGNAHAEAWRLQRIVVQDEDLQRSWTFHCHVYLNRDNGNMVELFHSGDIAAGRRASARASRRLSTGHSGAVDLKVLSDPGPNFAAVRSKFDTGSPKLSSQGESHSSARDFGVRRVCFKLQKYKRNNGHMYLFGATPALGKWETSKAHRMTMHTGADGTWRGQWRLELELDDDYDRIEYKYMEVDDSIDKAWLSAEVHVLILSDGTDSSNRTVEGGVIYVQDTFNVECAKSPFQPLTFPVIRRDIDRQHTIRTPSGKNAILMSGNVHDPPFSRLNGLQTPGRNRAIANAQSNESEESVIVQRRLEDHLDSAPDGEKLDKHELCLPAGASELSKEFNGIQSEPSEHLNSLPVQDGDFQLKEETPGALDAENSDRQDESPCNGTTSLRRELDVTRSLLSEKKQDMLRQDAEIQLLKMQRNESEFLYLKHAAANGPANYPRLLSQAAVEDERTSPVSSDCVVDEDITELNETDEERAHMPAEDSLEVHDGTKNIDMKREQSSQPGDAEIHGQPGSQSNEYEGDIIIGTLPPNLSSRDRPRSSELNSLPGATTTDISLPVEDVQSSTRTFGTISSFGRKSPSTPSSAPNSESRLRRPSLRETSNRQVHKHSASLISIHKVKRTATDINRDVDELRTELESLREDVVSHFEEHSLRNAELVRLVMDSREKRIAEQNLLIAERDKIYSRWVREFRERRKLFNTVQELRGNIRVFCRVRPLKEPRLSNRSRAPMAVSFPDATIGDGHSIQASSKTFEFAHVFGPEASQERVYRETSGVIESVLDGYNVCVFAYGQTGSGKTYTMNGTVEDRGVNYRALTDLFSLADERSDHSNLQVCVSMVEIYNDTLKDLIRDPETSDTPAPKLDIRRDPNSSSKSAVYVPHLTEVVVSSVDDVWNVMKRGEINRAMGATNMNEHSSRSHLIIRIRVDMENSSSGIKSTGILSLVDLAGSERVSRSNASGERLREAQHINKSLATLGDVFTALLAKSAHVPYRNSKLTYLLQDSLGGDSKTLMFVNVSCDDSDASETVSSLQFAQRVAKVELGTARRHTESTAATNAIASLREKEMELSSLQVQVAALQREVRKRDAALDDQKAKFRSTESELKIANKSLDEKRKREATDRGDALRELRELKSADEKRQMELRNAKLKVREVTKTKDEEIRRLRLLLEDRDRKLATFEQKIKPESVRPSSIVARPGTETSSSADATFNEVTTGTVSDPGSSDSVKRIVPSRPGLPRGSATFTARPRQVRFEEPTPEPKARETMTTDTVVEKQTGVPASSARRTASMSSLPRMPTSSLNPSRLHRQSSASSAGSGKRIVYAFGSRMEIDTTSSEPGSSASSRPTRPPRASTMKPQRVTGSSAHGGLLGRGTTRVNAGLRRSNTFASVGLAPARKTSGRSDS